MPNVELIKKPHISPFRKIAFGTWQTTYDPSIYGGMKLRMDKALDYIERFREHTGRRLTLTHLTTKACAMALKACPDANAMLRCNKLYLRKSIDISVLVVMESDGQIDLSATKVMEADQKSLVNIIDEIAEKAEKIRKREDKTLEQTRQSMKLVPSILMNAFLKLIAFFSYTLNLNLTWAGLPKDAFGSAVVTSIGSLGLDTGYVPLVPYSRVPIFIAPGRINDEPVVENGKIVPGKTLNLSATFDHRVIDGKHAAIMATTFRKMMEDPFTHFDPLD